MSMIKFPYTNLHELNLDWLIEKVKECYSPDNPPDDVVLSVNGETGDVILYKEADVQLPDIEDTSWNFFRLADGSAVGIKFNKGLPLERIYGSSRFQIYDTGNPPPYPVTSVNGQTGAITIQIAFGSLTGDTVSFLTSSPAHSWSLDRETLDGSASIRLDTTNDEISAYIEYVSSDDTVHSTLKLLTPADIPSSSGVVSVNGAAGVVVLTAEDIHRTGTNAETVEHCLESLTTDTQTMAAKIGSVGSTPLQAQINTIDETLADIQEDIGTVGETSLQDQVTALSGQITNLLIEFGTNSKDLTQNLTDNWRTAVPNDSRVYFVRINSLYGDFYGVICRYSDVYGTGVVSRYDGRVYRIQMDNGSCSSYQLQNRPIQVLSTGSKTISTNGNIGYTFNNKVLVLGVYSTSSDIVCSAYPASGADASGSAEWWIHCRNANSSSSVTSGTINCYIIYIDMA